VLRSKKTATESEKKNQEKNRQQEKNKNPITQALDIHIAVRWQARVVSLASRNEERDTALDCGSQIADCGS